MDYQKFKEERAKYNKKVADKMVQLCTNYDLRLMQLIHNINKGDDYFNEEPQQTLQRLVDFENAVNAFQQTDNDGRMAVKEEQEQSIAINKKQFVRLIEDILAVNRQLVDEDEYPSYLELSNAIVADFVDGYFNGTEWQKK